MAAYANVPALRTRRPTGIPSWPLVLVEGPEKSGKSWVAAEFTASERIGQAYWLDWVEGEGNEYLAIPGADYELIDHDGTWSDITGQIAAVHAEAQRAAEAGEKPVLLVIDSMTAEWEQLKDWADVRARNTDTAKKKLAHNPDAEIAVPMNVWTDVHDRHYQVMRRLLMKFPGIVVMIARGKETVALDDNGRPVQGSNDYKVEGHKNLAYDASAWVRLSRHQAPMVVGARSVHAGIRPGVDKPRQLADLSLDWLVFDVLLGGATRGQTRVLPEPQPEPESAAQPTPEEQQPAAAAPADGGPTADIDWDAALAIADNDYDALQQLWRAAVAGNAPVATLKKIKDAGFAALGATDTAAQDGGEQ